MDVIIVPRRGLILIENKNAIIYDPFGVEPNNELICYIYLIPLGLLN